MTDDIDRAQETERVDRELALRAVAERIAASFQPRAPGLEGICMDCNDPIETARLAVLSGKTSRCAACAHRHELRMRGYGR